MADNTAQRQWSKWLFHGVVWAILLALPLFSILPGRPILDVKDYLHYAVMVISFMAVFYVNWFLLIPRFLFSRKWALFLLWNLALIMAVMAVTHLLYRFLMPPMDTIRPMWGLRIRFLIGNTFLYLLVVMASVAVKMTGEWYRMDSLRKDLEKSRTEAELQNLKSQLNPHFLFNTLNNIYSLIQIDGGRAQEAVHDLGQLLRHVLYDSAEDYVSVQKEMDFIRDYVALMRIRLPRQATLELNLPEHPSARPVAPLLFISPIENAFKHGISNEQASFIRIAIREEEDRLVCDIRNSNFPKADGDRSGSGIGLKNLEQRLEMIYPGRYTFASGVEGDEYHSHLEVPL